jgi:hypothetical protein
MVLVALAAFYSGAPSVTQKACKVPKAVWSWDPDWVLLHLLLIHFSVAFSPISSWRLVGGNFSGGT